MSIGFAAVRDDVLEVTGGEVTKVRRLHPGSDDRNRSWELTIAPDGRTLNGPVTLTIPGPA